MVEEGVVYDVLTPPRSDLTRRLVAEVVDHGLPDSVAEQLTDTRTPGAATVLRIVFRDGAANTPVISRLSRDYGLDLHILHGRVDQIRGRTVRTLCNASPSAPEHLQTAPQPPQPLPLAHAVTGLRHTHLT